MDVAVSKWRALLAELNDDLNVEQVYFLQESYVLTPFKIRVYLVQYQRQIPLHSLTPTWP